MLIQAVSLVPLYAATLAVFLAWVAWRQWQAGTRISLFFLALNMATFLWSACYAIELSLPTAVVLDVAPIGSAAYFLYIVEMIGIAAAPTYWFLFCAVYARKYEWASGWRLALVHVPLIYTVIVTATNPLHQLFVSQAAPGAPAAYGPLAIPHMLGTYVLVPWGIWLIVTTSWRRGTPASRRQARVLGAASMTTLAGGLLWGLRGVLHLPLAVNPVPLLFALLDLVLLNQVLRYGLGDVAQVASRQTFLTTTDTVLVTDDAGRIAAFNPAAARLLTGIKVGDDIMTAVPEIGAHASRCLVDDEYVEFEMEVADTTQWGRVRRTRDRRDSALGCIVLLTDVTDLRLAQRGLEDANEELRRRVFELGETNRKLDEATRAKSDFLASMSHELRTPLNSVIGFSTVLLQGLAGELEMEQREQISMIQHSGKRLLTQVDDILDLSRIESGRAETNIEPVSLRPILDSVMDELRIHAAEKRLQFSLRCPAQDVTVVTDPRALEQILVNLVANAIKFTDEGRVVLEADLRDQFVALRVIDTGIGIPPESLDRVFEEFERIESSDGVIRPGTGLGLSICRRLAELIGATLTVESRPEWGSTFTVSVPRDGEGPRSSLPLVDRRQRPR